MIVECIAIIGVIGLVIFGFLRGGKSDYALAVVPLLFVPFAHAAGELFAAQIAYLTVLESFHIIILFDIIALAISCGMTAYFSTKIESLKNIKMFYGLLFGYLIVLTCVLIYNVIPQFNI